MAPFNSSGVIQVSEFPKLIWKDKIFTVGVCAFSCSFISFSFFWVNCFFKVQRRQSVTLEEDKHQPNTNLAPQNKFLIKTPVNDLLTINAFLNGPLLENGSSVCPTVSCWDQESAHTASARQKRPIVSLYRLLRSRGRLLSSCQEQTIRREAQGGSGLAPDTKLQDRHRSDWDKETKTLWF